MKNSIDMLTGLRWSPRAIELWGGVECTLNRVGKTYLEQLVFNGHRGRLGDLDAFAKLGIKRLRAPFLWEQHAQRSLDQPDWSWARERLDRMQRLGIEPIVGLLHHGSGPKDTSLLDPAFAVKFAHYARAFAEMFPHVIDYTPINEPLTTARFSCLYGSWYPHRKSTGDFARAVINQLQATALAMKEIRKVQPRARLIQTEDLGRTTGSADLAYQVDHENERRWLTLDLLTGNFTPDRPLYDYFLKLGISQSELHAFLEHPAPPQVYGINHYVTSNRHLDSNLADYPIHLHGGNKVHAYVDVEAARVGDLIPTTLESLLHEAWNRYRIPLAITEAHLDCTREEQMRWLKYVWDSCENARLFGVDVRAVTVWGLLGHFDWNCHVTSCRGYYESGVFDLRDDAPRPTALAQMLTSYSENKKPESPVLAQNGWWARPRRAHYRYDTVAGAQEIYNQDAPHFGPGFRPLLVVGDATELTQQLVRACEIRALPYVLTNADQSLAAADRCNPWAVIYTNASLARVEDGDCRALTFVPFNVGELEINSPNELMVRTGHLFSPTDKNCFPSQWLSQMLANQMVKLNEVDPVAFSYTPDVVRVALDLLIDGESGPWLLANEQSITPKNFMIQLQRRLAIGQTLGAQNVAPRSHDTSVSFQATRGGQMLPKLEEALERFVWESDWIPTELKLNPRFDTVPNLNLRKDFL